MAMLQQMEKSLVDTDPEIAEVMVSMDIFLALFICSL